jgi:hypothetical protein
MTSIPLLFPLRQGGQDPITNDQYPMINFHRKLRWGGIFLEKGLPLQSSSLIEKLRLKPGVTKEKSIKQ